jgi:hypothetical protein
MTTASIEGSEVRRPAQAKRPTNERSILETTVIQVFSTIFPEEGEKRMIEQLETLEISPKPQHVDSQAFVPAIL